MLQNNIAEVEELQADLMEEDLLEHILSLLQDSHIELGVRYFAGGILAHVASRPEAWTLDEELHSTIVKQLVGGVAVRPHSRKNSETQLWLFSVCFPVFAARFYYDMDSSGERNGVLQVSGKDRKQLDETFPVNAVMFNIF